MSLLGQVDRYIQKKTFSKADQVLLLSDYVEVTKYTAPSDYFKLLYRYKKGAVRMFAFETLDELNSGGSLSTSAKYWFDPMLVKAIEIGEKNGKIDETLPIALKIVSENTAGIAASFAGLIKPTFYLCALLAVMFTLKESLVPLSLKMVKNDVTKLSDGLRNLLDMTNWIAEYGYLIPISIITVVIWFAQHLRNNVGPLRNRLDKLPIYKQYALFIGSQFIMNYAVTKELGETDQKIIAAEYNDANPYYKKHLKSFSENLSTGKKDLDEILSGSLFDEEFLGRLRTISGSQDFTAALKSAALKTNQDIIRKVTKMMWVVAQIYLVGVVLLLIPLINAIYSTD